MPYAFSDETFDLSVFLSMIPEYKEKTIVLFGAAGWGESLLSELSGIKLPNPVIFADNDETKQGKSLKGVPVIPPTRLSPENHRVVITTISAGDAVSAQLEQMGFVRDVTYFEVMRNLTARPPVDVVSFYLGMGIDIPGKTILHVGPGGHLGVETILAAMGAEHVASIDYNAYGIHYPDVTKAQTFYRKLGTLAREKFGVDPHATGILKTCSGQMRINEEKVTFYCPCSVSQMPFPDNTFDYVLHHAVFEHVADPAQGYREIARVLKAGGRTVGLVDPQDHRQFASYEGYHPLKFLEHSPEEWKKITRKINYHNQCPTPFHQRLIMESGLGTDRFHILRSMEVPDTLLETFSKEFQSCDPHQLGILRFSFSASKG